jgi:hypothetical protein
MGCAANIEVQSNKDKTYSQKLGRVLLVMSLRESKTALTPSDVAQSLAAKWQPFGVTVEVGTRPEDATSFQPTQVMTLATVQTLERGGNLWSYVVDGSITDVATKKRIWRSSLKFDLNISGPRGVEESGKKTAPKLADVLTEKLQADGLL